MILQAFAKNMQGYVAKIPPIIILSRWLKDILKREPVNNVEKIIHTELTLLENDNRLYAVVGKTPSGQKLLENLYKFIGCIENHNFSTWLHNKNSNIFNENYSE